MTRKDKGKPKAQSTRWPCIFIYNQTRQIDDEIQEKWKERFGVGAPFGSLRKEWRAAHCRKLNPGGSWRCPYQNEQCVSAYAEAVRASLKRDIIDPRVYFISVARSSALERADNKPLARETYRIATQATEGPGVTGVVGSGDHARRARDVGTNGGAAGTWDQPRSMDEIEAPDMRRSLSRPAHIGSLLRQADSGARKGSAADRGGQNGSALAREADDQGSV